MSTEYDRILQLLTYETESEKLPIEELVRLTLDFTDRYQAVMKSGTDKEKDEIQEQMQTVKEKIREQAEVKQEEVKLTQEELKALGRDPKNFTEEQWNILEKARQEIEKHKVQRQPQEAPGGRSSKRTSRKSKWQKG